MTFPFNDWYRSTDNGGSGVHTTPDGEVPRQFNCISGYETGMALFNNGEVYIGVTEVTDKTVTPLLQIEVIL